MYIYPNGAFFFKIKVNDVTKTQHRSELLFIKIYVYIYFRPLNYT